MESGLPVVSEATPNSFESSRCHLPCSIMPMTSSSDLVVAVVTRASKLYSLIKELLYLVVRADRTPFIILKVCSLRKGVRKLLFQNAVLDDVARFELWDGSKADPAPYLVPPGFSGW